MWWLSLSDIEKTNKNLLAENVYLLEIIEAQKERLRFANYETERWRKSYDEILQEIQDILKDEDDDKWTANKIKMIPPP